MKSDDLAALIASQGGSGVDLHTGLVKAWNSDAGTNTIEVLGTDVYDLPVLTSAGIVTLQAGTSVVIMRYKNTYFIVGQVVGVGSELAQPQFPVILYPQFQSSIAAGTSGSAHIPTGVLASWEGRFRPSHPRIEVHGVWGNASGTGSTTYSLRVWQTEVASWTVGAAVNNVRGPFDISQYVGQDWAQIDVTITSSTGTGQKYFQILGAYLMQADQ